MGLMKKLTSALVASSLVLSLVGSAFAAYTPAAGEEAGTRMQKLGIIQGRDGNDLALNSEITRAELVTVIVRAFGKEDDAKLLKGSTIFPDIANHWASGNIAMAVALVEKAGSDPIGMPDGTFAPDAKLTPAQAVAFLMKFMGAKADATKAWPANYLDVAVEKGLITTEDKALIAPMLNDNATRGLVFYMFDRAFAEYNLGAGKTFYTKYVDTIAPELSLDAVAETTMDSKVTISGTVKGHTKLHVGTTAVTADANGKFSAEVALAEIDSYDITVTAQDLAGNVTEKTVSVARVTGEAVAISAPASIEVVAGETADVAAKVIDANDVALADVNVDGASDLGTYENGVFTAGETAGTGTLTLTYGDLTKEVAVTVKAGALAKLSVSPATVDLNVGANQKFTVTGADEFGNEVAATGTVVWSASKGVMGADGTYGAQNDATGTVTVTAAIGDVTGTATVNVSGVATKLALATPANVIANGASKSQVVATLQDVAGNPVKTYTGNVTFSITNTAVATLKETSVAVVNGQAVVELTAGTTVGSAIISATATGLAGATTTLTSVAQVPTSVEAKADPASLAADSGSTSTVSLVMLDQDGKPMVSQPSGAWTYSATSSDNNIVTVTSSGNFALTSGKFQAGATVTAVNNIGAANLTFTVKKDAAASTVAANAVTINTQVVGVPHKYAIDPIDAAKAAGTTAEKTQTVVVRILDANGNQVTGATSTASKTYTFNEIPALSVTSGSTTAVITQATSFSNGKIVYTVVNPKAEDVTYKVSGGWRTTGAGSAIPVAEATATGTFVPGAAASVTIAATPAKPIAANGTATATLTVKIVDGSAQKNLVKDGSYSVTVKRSAGTAISFSDTTVTTVDGVATLTVTAGTAIGDTDFTATVRINNADQTSAAARVSTTIIGVSNKLSFDGATTLAAATLTNATAGAAKTVKVNVLDANGVVNTLDNSSVVTLKVKDSAGAETAYTAVAAGGTAAFDVTLNTKGAYTLSAESPNLVSAAGTTTPLIAGTSLTVDAADAVGIKVTGQLDTMQADTTSKQQIKAVLVDQFGNETTAGTLDLSGLSAFTNSNTAVGTLSNWSLDGSNDFATADFQSTSLPGTATISLSKSGLNGGSYTITTVLAAPAAKLAIAVDADKKISSTENGTNYQKVTVTVLDAAGNRVTGYAKKIGLAFDGTVSANAAIFTNNTGTAYTAPVTTTLGAVSFYVTNDKAQAVTYKATAYDADGTTATSTVSTVTATGTFVHGKANTVAVDTASPAVILGNGSSIAGLTARVVDDKGNTVVSANGNIKFEVNSAFAFIQGGASDGSLTVPVSGGMATIILQAKNVTSNSLVSVKATFAPSDSTITVATPAATNANALAVVATSDAAKPTGTAAWSGNDITVAYTSTDGAFGLAPVFKSSTDVNVVGITAVTSANQKDWTVKLVYANGATAPAAGSTVTLTINDGNGNTEDVVTPAK